VFEKKLVDSWKATENFQRKNSEYKTFSHATFFHWKLHFLSEFVKFQLCVQIYEIFIVYYVLIEMNAYIMYIPTCEIYSYAM